MQSRSVVVFTLALAVIATGCNGCVPDVSSRGGDGERCRVDGTCKTGLACEDGRCGWPISDAGVVSTDAGGAKDTGVGGPDSGIQCAMEGEPCQLLDDCCNDGICLNDLCQPCSKRGEYCRSEYDCCHDNGYHFCLHVGYGNNKCEPCRGLGAECRADTYCCPADEGGGREILCLLETTCGYSCRADRDCVTSDELCDLATYSCNPRPCTADAECIPPAICTGGACGEYPAAIAESCAIISRQTVVVQGRSTRLNAIAFRGNNLVRVEAFSWSSYDEAKVMVGPDGVATGQDTEGDAVISARLGELDCGTITVRNVLPTSAGATRVFVLDQKTGKPVIGALVMGANGVFETTDSIGKAVLATSGEIHVFHPDYSYVSLLGIGSDDLLVHLPPVRNLGAAGGYHGYFDGSAVKFHSHPQSWFGLTACGISGDALGLGSTPIFGGTCDMQAWGGDCPGGTYFDCYMCENIPGPYKVQCGEGYQAVWGLWTALVAADYPGINSIFTNYIMNNPFPARGRLVMSQLFHKGGHGSFTGVKIDLLPTVPSPYDKSRLVPDYDRFPALDVVPSEGLLVKSVLSLPELPPFHNGRLIGVLAIGGVFVDDLGFVPLGITGALDTYDPDLPPDGMVMKPILNPEGITDGQAILAMPPAYHGLEDRGYRFALMAVDEYFGAGPSDTMSVTLRSSDTLASSYDFTGTPFMAVPEGASFEPAARTVNQAVVPGAGFYRYRVGLDDLRDWDLYVAPGSAAPVMLPPVPAGMTDIHAGSNLALHAVRLRDGLSAADLFSTSSALHPDRWMNVIDQFSTLPCRRKLQPGDDGYAENCVDQKYPDPACDPACEVR